MFLPLGSRAVSSQPIIRARKGGFLHDMLTVSQRALRATVRDTEVIIPALVIPVFMYAMTVGALENFAERIPGLNYRAFQIPVAVLFAVTGVSRAMTVVIDIQTGYFDRLVISPVNRLALLLGLMVADFALVAVLTVPVIIMAIIVGVHFETGIPGILVFMAMGGSVGANLQRIPVRHRIQTRKSVCSQHKLPSVFPLPLHDHPVRPPRGNDRLAGYGCRLQPGDLPAGRTAVSCV